MDKEQIKKQAKQILDNFASALEKAGIKTEDVFVERDEFSRKETQTDKPNSEFKKLMLKNAPDKDENYIKAEKGGWIE